MEASWETIKDAERAAKGQLTDDARADPLHGIPVAMPPLARATKVVSRLRRRGHADALETALTTGPDDEEPGRRLLALVARMEAAGDDPDQALRAVLRRLAGS